MPVAPPRTSHPLAKPAAAIEGASDGLADALEREEIEEEVHEATHRAGEAFGASPSPRTQRLRARLDRVDEKVDEVVDKARVRARAVAETARRARDAPPTVAEELTGALKAWTSGLAKGLALKVAAGAVAIIALVVLTIALVQGLNQEWGAPRGTAAVGVGYLVLTLLLFMAGKGEAAKGKEEAKERLDAAKDEVRHVTRPVRRAFRGDQDLAARSGAIDAAPIEELPVGEVDDEEFEEQARERLRL